MPLYTKPTDAHMYVHYNSNRPTKPKRVADMANFSTSREYAPEARTSGGKPKSSHCIDHYKIIRPENILTNYYKIVQRK